MSPTLDARPTPWQLSALITLLTLSGCPLDSCAARCEPHLRPWVEGNLVDAQGNDVPITTVIATQDGFPLRCGETVFDGGTGQQPSASNVAHFECEGPHSGVVEVAVTGAGHTVTTQIEVTTRQPEGCDVPGLDAEPAVLTLPGPGCPPASGTAIEGRLLDAEGNPAEGKLWVNHGASNAECTTSEGHFRCPALSPYATQYLLQGDVSISRIARLVPVAAEACQPSTTQLDIDLSDTECSGEQRPALEGNFRAECMPKAAEPAARVRVADSEFVPCEIRFANPSQGRCLYTLICPALTSTGGGTYTVEVSQGSDSATVERDVHDDGCSPFTSRVNVPDPF